MKTLLVLLLVTVLFVGFISVPFKVWRDIYAKIVVVSYFCLPIFMIAVLILIGIN